MSRLGSALSGGEEQERASGWGLSDDKKHSYGFAWSRGKRSTMEDCYEARFAQVDGFNIGLFGVFDGHGGSQASEYVCKRLFDNLVNHPKLITDTKVAIVETYQKTDSEFLQAEVNQKHDAGSTASTAILVGDRLLVANVGDSRAVLCRDSTAIPVSEDHKPSRKDERQRIEDAGGVVIWAGTWRVGGILAVSRAFGDRSLKQFVVAEPDVYEETIDDRVKFLILASDGLWDVVSNQEAVTMVEAIPDAEEAAKSLVDEAICKGSADNVTCIVICFHNGITEEQNEPS